mmetsp:Transcript_14937/g.44275  ORF Transcript_14937/g.44275 Transcript_14937/m.44275 type:complete len:288 (-) Transcript_14937:1095-1958(-)
MTLLSPPTTASPSLVRAHFLVSLRDLPATCSDCESGAGDDGGLPDRDSGGDAPRRRLGHGHDRGYCAASVTHVPCCAAARRRTQSGFGAYDASSCVSSHPNQTLRPLLHLPRRRAASSRLGFLSCASRRNHPRPARLPFWPPETWRLWSRVPGTSACLRQKSERRDWQPARSGLDCCQWPVPLGRPGPWPEQRAPHGAASHPQAAGSLAVQSLCLVTRGVRLRSPPLRCHPCRPRPPLPPLPPPLLQQSQPPESFSLSFLASVVGQQEVRVLWIGAHRKPDLDPAAP